MNKIPYSDHQHISSKADLLSFQKQVNYFYVPNCAEELVKAYGGKQSSYQSGICLCLKGERPYISRKLNLECAYKIQR